MVLMQHPIHFHAPGSLTKKSLSSSALMAIFGRSKYILSMQSKYTAIWRRVPTNTSDGPNKYEDHLQFKSLLEAFYQRWKERTKRDHFRIAKKVLCKFEFESFSEDEHMERQFQITNSDLITDG